MSKIRIEVDEDKLVNALDGFISAGGVRDLIKDMFNHTQKAKEILGQLLLGEKLPIKPTISQMGYVKIEHMWFTNKEFTLDTDLDVKGTLSCKVVRINGYTEYSQVTIEFPTYDSAGEIQIISNGVAFDQFIWLQEDLIKDSI
jgi:hypothetical protein